jgi:hypothetical protein
MRIIDDLINELTDKTKSLTDILIKTKILAYKLKNSELKLWIDNELNGYQAENIPEYRIVACQLVGTISNGFQRANNYPIPLIGFDEDLKEKILTFRLSQSISTLDHFINKEKGGKMQISVPAELYGYLSKDFGSGFVVEYARKEIDKTQVVQLLTAVRTKLLDFLLQLNDEFGDDDNEKKLEEEQTKEKVSSMFHSSFFGNNTTIIVGNNNIQNVSNITKGSFKSLAKVLKENGVSKADIQELQTVIEIEKPVNQQFGAGVKKWISKMLNKAVEGSWEISLGAAGSLLADAIATYYGWN